MNEDESLKCLNLSKNRFSEGDFEGALRLAIKAQRMFDSSETREWLEKVKTQDNETNSNIRQRHVKTEEIKIEEFISTTTTTKSETTAAYTPEQSKEVKEFLKRNKDDYYSILGVEKSASQDELKKAYKKLALKFHPDKNQAPGADEAFKTISVAFSVLGDEEKRRNFDRYGVSGTNGGGPGGSTAGPFASPFGTHFGSSGGFNFHESGEISPEELFNLFFNAAFSQANPHARHTQHQGNPFFFTSNFHSGPGYQQRREQGQGQRQARRQSPETENEEFLKKIIQFIPLIIVFFLSIISSWIFPSESASYNNPINGNEFSLNPSGKHRFQRSTRLKNVPYYATSNFQKYFANIKDNVKLSRELSTYENLVETSFIKELKKSCDLEQRELSKILKKAKKDQIEEIKNNFKLNYCEKLKSYE